MHESSSRWTISRRALLAGMGTAVADPVKLPEKVRVAIIGLEGHTGEITGQLKQLPDVEIVAICDEDAKAVERFARHPQLAAAHRYSDYRRLLDSEKLDVAAVCNNNGARAAAILACLDRKLHVIAEKPLSINRPDLERIKKTVARQNVKLGMLLGMRYEPCYRALRQIVESGEIGEVAQISSQKSYKLGAREDWYTHRETYGSTILWIGIHMIDLMRFTSGREFTHASSFMGHVGFPELGAMENTTVSGFRLDNRGTASLHMDYYRPETAPTHGDDRLRLAGTKGVAEYMDATGGVTLITTKSKLTTISGLPPAGSVFVDFLENVYNGKPATLPLADIYRVCEITLAANDAAFSGKIVPIV
ncbi:MAG TPA: Gfo/Idh/MocA family oxidoreductase [Bryobacteraceae bacterium]|nr:Gfo/Idh/MocA family oxidoreductase [Bryobacteraceae bacterium]